MQALRRQLVASIERGMALRGLILPVPNGLHNTNMDNLLADSLPLLTMLACVPVLRLFARQHNFTDLVRSTLEGCVVCPRLCTLLSPQNSPTPIPHIVQAG